MHPSTKSLPPDDTYKASRALYEGARQYLAGGVSSNFRLGGPAAIFYARAAGCKLYSVDGVEYIDYALGMGPVILGHAPEHVIRKVSESLVNGQLYGGQYEAEKTLARMICAAFPCAERVRFGCSGSEVVHAALR